MTINLFVIPRFRPSFIFVLDAEAWIKARHPSLA